MRWTPAQVATMMPLWLQGVYAREIGAIVKRTKNAVLGKAHRLGIEYGSVEPPPPEPPSPELPEQYSPGLPPPEPGEVCTKDGCRGPRQRGHRLGWCAECIHADIMVSKEDQPTLIDAGHSVPFPHEGSQRKPWA